MESVTSWPRIRATGFLLKRYRPALEGSLIEEEAAQAGLAPEIAEAVMAVESGYNPDAIGGVGEIGLMQILPRRHACWASPARWPMRDHRTPRSGSSISPAFSSNMAGTLVFPSLLSDRRRRWSPHRSGIDEWSNACERSALRGRLRSRGGAAGSGSLSVPGRVAAMDRSCRRHSAHFLASVRQGLRCLFRPSVNASFTKILCFTEIRK